MATRYWIGTDAGNEGEWGTAANWSGAAVPVTGDTVIFDGRSTQSVTADFDQTGVDLANLYIFDSFTGSIGTATAHLIIEVSGQVIIEGTGNYYLQAGNDNNDADINNIWINVPTTSTVKLSSQKNNANIAKFQTIYFVRGNLTLVGNADAAAITSTPPETGTYAANIFVAPLGNNATNCTLTIGDQCYDKKNTTYTLVNMINGTANIYSSLSTVRLSNGTMNIGGTGYSMGTADDLIAAVYLYGGTFNWQPSVVSGGVRTTAAADPVITSAYLFGGTFKGGEMLETLTTAPTITTLYQSPSATVNIDNGYANFVITNYYKRGGTLITSSGQAITLA